MSLAQGISKIEKVNYPFLKLEDAIECGEGWYFITGIKKSVFDKLIPGTQVYYECEAELGEFAEGGVMAIKSDKKVFYFAVLPLNIDPTDKPKFIPEDDHPWWEKEDFVDYM